MAYRDYGYIKLTETESSNLIVLLSKIKSLGIDSDSDSISISVRITIENQLKDLIRFVEPERLILEDDLYFFLKQIKEMIEMNRHSDNIDRVFSPIYLFIALL